MKERLRVLDFVSCSAASLLLGPRAWHLAPPCLSCPICKRGRNRKKHFSCFANAERNDSENENHPQPAGPDPAPPRRNQVAAAPPRASKASPRASAAQVVLGHGAAGHSHVKPDPAQRTCRPTTEAAAGPCRDHRTRDPTDKQTQPPTPTAAPKLETPARLRAGGSQGGPGTAGPAHVPGAPAALGNQPIPAPRAQQPGGASPRPGHRPDTSSCFAA